MKQAEPNAGSACFVFSASAYLLSLMCGVGSGVVLL